MSKASLAVIAVIVCTLFSDARGGVIPYDISFGPETFSLGTKIGGTASSNSSTTLHWNGGLELNLIFPQFNPAHGSLTEVRIDFGGAVAASADILFLNDNPPPFNVSGINVNMTTNVTLLDPARQSLTFDSEFLNRSTTATSSGSPFHFPIGSELLDAPVVVVPPNQHADYVGTGTVTLPMNINFLAEATTSNGGFVVTPYPTIAISPARIEYEFSAVPEPSSFVLFASAMAAFLGVAFCRRMRHHRNSRSP